MHGEVVLAVLALVVAVLVAADFFRRPWLVRTRLCLLAVVSAAAAVLATGGVIRAAGAFQRASAHSQASSMHDGAIAPAVLALVFAVAVLAAGLWSALILIRSVLRPLYQLRAGTVELAEVWLPDALRTSSQAGGESRQGVIGAVGVSALDEIGDIARAVDRVQREVLGLAGREAGLRGKLSEMLGGLSGRGQSLMERQLRLIDELGQGEDDAGRRASLVTVSRLAARMRRHSQNMLVLAGLELPGRWNQPAMLADVIGAAVAQAGEHERVSVSVQPDIAVSGPAVNDVVHLLAELAENAASLSATDTPVAISGGTLATGGVLVEVTDQGVGMSPQMMAKANWWLEHPPPVDVAVSRNMGLFVVGRLAARHGIKVRLQPATTGGLTALVWLPDLVIVRPQGSGPRVPWRLRALAPSQASPAEDPADGRRLPIYEAVESDWFSRRGHPRPDASGPVRSADAARNRLAGFQRGPGRGRAASGHDGQDQAP